MNAPFTISFCQNDDAFSSQAVFFAADIYAARSQFAKHMASIGAKATIQKIRCTTILH